MIIVFTRADTTAPATFTAAHRNIVRAELFLLLFFQFAFLRVKTFYTFQLFFRFEQHNNKNLNG